MDLNKLTLKSQEALAASQKLAAQLNHQTIEPEHLLHSLLSQRPASERPSWPGRSLSFSSTTSERSSGST